MSRTEQLIEEICHLPGNEVQAVYRALAERLAVDKQVDGILARVRGLGAGVWGEDAQEYINALREDDRR